MRRSVVEVIIVVMVMNCLVMGFFFRFCLWLFIL